MRDGLCTLVPFINFESVVIHVVIQHFLHSHSKAWFSTSSLMYMNMYMYIYSYIKQSMHEKWREKLKVCPAWHTLYILHYTLNHY